MHLKYDNYSNCWMLDKCLWSTITYDHKKNAILCVCSITCLMPMVIFLFCLCHLVWTHFHMLEQRRLVNLYTWEFHVLQSLVQCMHTMLVLVSLAKLVRICNISQWISACLFYAHPTFGCMFNANPPFHNGLAFNVTQWCFSCCFTSYLGNCDFVECLQVSPKKCLANFIIYNISKYL